MGICFSKADFDREMVRLKVKGPTDFIISGAHATCHTFDNDGNADVCVICIDGATAHKGRAKIHIYGLLAHECMHVLQSCKAAMREKEAGHETEAYFLQYILLFCMNEYETYMKKGRKK